MSEAAAAETPAKKVKAPKAAPKEGKKVKAAKAPKETKARGAKPGPRSAPEGFVTLNQVAQEVGKDPAVCRRILRAAEVSVEGRFWMWKDGSRDLNKVRDLLSKGE